MKWTIVNEKNNSLNSLVLCVTMSQQLYKISNVHSLCHTMYLITGAHVVINVSQFPTLNVINMRMPLRIIRSVKLHVGNCLCAMLQLHFHRASTTCFCGYLLFFFTVANVLYIISLLLNFQIYMSM